jgi:hypothetical protein
MRAKDIVLGVSIVLLGSTSMAWIASGEARISSPFASHSVFLILPFQGGSSPPIDAVSREFTVDVRDNNIVVPSDAIARQFTVNAADATSSPPSDTISRAFTVFNPPLPGDVNYSGCVDDADLLIVLFAFGSVGQDLAEDLNDDGGVDDVDLLLVLFNFGNGC